MKLSNTLEMSFNMYDQQKEASVANDVVRYDLKTSRAINRAAI